MNALEKVEAYDKAVEKARQEYNATENVERKQWLEELFPQLNENKDEKFRKYILKCCEETIQANDRGLELSMDTTKKLKNWLEKQDKKQTYQSNERAWLYLVADVLTWMEGIGQYLDDPRVQELAKKLQKEYSQKLYVEKQVKQKPTWTDNDRIMAFTLLRDVDQMTYISKEGKNERLEWLNSLEDRFKNE